MPRKKSTTRKTPVTVRGSSIYPDTMKTFMEEWSLSQAEQNHVETIEEANDFDIGLEPEDEDFFGNLTVYEMHEMAEENLRYLERLPPLDQDESNETLDSGANQPQPSHDQSAPIEQNSPDPEQ